MVENITSLTSCGVQTITSFIMQRWQWLVGVAVSMGVGIMFGWYKIRTKNMEHVFRNVKIIVDQGDGDTCTYYPQNPEDWLKVRVVKVYLWGHGALGLLKKVKKANKKSEECIELVKKKLWAIITARVETQLPFNHSTWDFSRREPDADYTMPTNLPDSIIAIIRGEKSFEFPKDSERYVLFCRGILGKFDTESKRNEYKNLIEYIIHDPAIGQLVAEIDNAKREKDEAEKAFKKKLATIVRNLRVNAGGL